MAKVNVEESIMKYETFIHDVLKEDLRMLEFHLNYINGEVAELTQQRHALKVISDTAVHPRGFKTQMNLGCNFFMEASVTDTSKLLMNIGLNHYLEFSLAEAYRYLEARIIAFEEKSKELQKKATNTKAHVKLMLFGITELQKQV